MHKPRDAGLFCGKHSGQVTSPFRSPACLAIHLIAEGFVDSFAKRLFSDAIKGCKEAVPCGIEAQGITKGPVDKPGNKLVGTCGIPGIGARGPRATQDKAVREPVDKSVGNRRKTGGNARPLRPGGQAMQRWLEWASGLGARACSMKAKQRLLRSTMARGSWPWGCSSGPMLTLMVPGDLIQERLGQ